ncbi:hypothetical protein [Kitasatospora sp. McL0602]|uniref:hypothetical protein n=1 Tax=Kitasatospora sp. McL0602 TaxID=3439530 RepID=UPI003F897A26
MGTSTYEQSWDSVAAAHRALHGIFLGGKQAGQLRVDIELAGPAFVGVLSAFFRNVVERVFSGHESVRAVQSYLELLKSAYPEELSALLPHPMAVFLLEQIGPGAPPPGRSALCPLEGGVIHQMRLVVEYVARYENLAGPELELYLQGSCARYYVGDC